ncbi:hypothetical protein [Metabacillus sp. FJAT-52054]|uniref:Lipoprotein n=1 Tax=Metabacillus sediminis TaxID=3117746 RepID=A0ABZ2NIZ6_9BACI
MEKLLMGITVILLLVSCSPKHHERMPPERITLLSYVKMHLYKEVEITDLRNGGKTILKDPNDVNTFLNMLEDIELTKSDDQEVRKGGFVFDLQFKKEHLSLASSTVMIDGMRYQANRPLPVDQIAQIFFNPPEASP